jgi:hypothetical protein
MPRPHIPAKLKRLVIARARGRCEYCLSPVSHAVSSFAIEHIIPLEKGGKTTASNLALSCQGCNNHKHIKTEAIDPITKRLVPLFHPRRRKWREHFAWNEDCSLVIGLTPIGRATMIIHTATPASDRPSSPAAPVSNKPAAPPGRAPAKRL